MTAAGTVRPDVDLGILDPSPLVTSPGISVSRWIVFPTHGGCGAGTVVALLDPDRTGRAVEAVADLRMPTDTVPVVVARSSAYGTASACEVISRWPTDLPDPWLVVVADAPARPPQTARFYLRAVRDRVSGIARVGYLPRLRTVVSVGEILDDPSVARASRALRRQLGS